MESETEFFLDFMRTVFVIIFIAMNGLYLHLTGAKMSRSMQSFLCVVAVIANICLWGFWKVIKYCFTA
jgi:hypothetical protein